MSMAKLKKKTLGMKLVIFLNCVSPKINAMVSTKFYQERSKHLTMHFNVFQQWQYCNNYKYTVLIEELKVYDLIVDVC